MKYRIVRSKPAVALRFFLCYTALFALAISQSSCNKHFYQIQAVDTGDSATFNLPGAEHKYIIIHTPGEVFSLKNVSISGGTLSGEKNDLDPKYKNYLDPQKGESEVLKNRDKHTIFKIVHIYTRDPIGTERVSITNDQLIEVLDYGVDKTADENAKITGITVFAGVVVATISLLVTSLRYLNF